MVYKFKIIIIKSNIKLLALLFLFSLMIAYKGLQINLNLIAYTVL